MWKCGWCQNKGKYRYRYFTRGIDVSYRHTSYRYISINCYTPNKQHSYICSNSQQYIVWVKIIIFSCIPKIIRILCSMKILPILNISKLNYWLLICIAKNFIWTTLKMIFSIFRFFCSLRFQIFKYCPNHTSIESWFNWPYDWFCAPGSQMRCSYTLWCFEERSDTSGTPCHRCSADGSPECST